MKHHLVSKPNNKNAHSAKGYDQGVEDSGPGLENRGELIAPAAIKDQLDPFGYPYWDDSERAAPPPSASMDGENISIKSVSTLVELSLDELRKRAEVLNIPGRLTMTKMELAIAVSDGLN